MTIGTAASSVFLPRVSELYCQNKDMSEISDLFIKVGRISFIVCGFVLSLFIVLGKDFIIIWAGKDYIDAFYIALIVMVPFTIDLIQNLGLTIMQVANVYLYRGYMYLAIAQILPATARTDTRPHAELPLQRFFHDETSDKSTGTCY